MTRLLKRRWLWVALVPILGLVMLAAHDVVVLSSRPWEDGEPGSFGLGLVIILLIFGPGFTLAFLSGLILFLVSRGDQRPRSTD